MMQKLPKPSVNICSQLISFIFIFNHVHCALCSAKQFLFYFRRTNSWQQNRNVLSILLSILYNYFHILSYDFLIISSYHIFSYLISYFLILSYYVLILSYYFLILSYNFLTLSNYFLIPSCYFLCLSYNFLTLSYYFLILSKLSDNFLRLILLFSYLIL